MQQRHGSPLGRATQKVIENSWPRASLQGHDLWGQIQLVCKGCTAKPVTEALWEGFASKKNRGQSESM